MQLCIQKQTFLCTYSLALVVPRTQDKRTQSYPRQPIIRILPASQNSDCPMNFVTLHCFTFSRWNLLPFSKCDFSRLCQDKHQISVAQTSASWYIPLTYHKLCNNMLILEWSQLQCLYIMYCQCIYSFIRWLLMISLDVLPEHLERNGKRSKVLSTGFVLGAFVVSDMMLAMLTTK